MSKSDESRGFVVRGPWKVAKDSAERDQRALVKHLPDTPELERGEGFAQPPLVVPEWEFPPDQSIKLQLAIGRRGDDSSPIDRMRTFIHTHEEGFYPPKSALEWLVAGFRRYLDDWGRTSLDDCLGLNRGPGKETWIRKECLEERDQFAAIDMYRLTHYGATIAAAAELVAERFAAEQWDNTPLNLAGTNPDEPHPSAAWLEEQFRRTWKKQYSAFGLPQFFDKCTDDERRAWLARFPDGKAKRKVLSQIGMG